MDKTGLRKFLIKPDWETVRWGHKLRGVADVKGQPGVMPLSYSPDMWPQTSYTTLTKRWQWFWVDLLAMSKYGKLFDDLSKVQRNSIVTAFGDLAKGDKFLTNYKGVDTLANYPAKQNLKRKDPRVESLCCVLNYLYSYGETAVASRGKNKGKTMIKVLTFKSGSYPPEVTPELLATDPRIQIATTVRKGNRVGGFPHLKGKPVPFALLTQGDAWYSLEDLEEVENV